MRLYQAFDTDYEEPVQFAAVHVIRWRPEWGEPALLFREVDDETQSLADVAPDLLVALEACCEVWDTDAAGGFDDPEYPWETCKEEHELAEKLTRAALAKARGGGLVTPAGLRDDSPAERRSAAKQPNRSR